MDASMTIDAGIPEEIVDTLIERMTAPDGDRFEFAKTVWWKKGIVFGSFAGLLLGLTFYLLAQSGESNGMESSKHRTIPIKATVATASMENTGKTKNVVLTSPKEKEAGVEHDTSPSLLTPSISRDKKSNKGHKIQISTLEINKRKPRKKTRNKGLRRLLKRGWNFYSQGKYQSASVVFGRAVHLNPRHTGGYYGLALCLFEQGKENVALKVLEKGSKKVGPKAGLWVLAGSIYQWMGKEKMARLAYARYLRKHPHGEYARDLRVILSRKKLPKLLPFDDELSYANNPDSAE